MNRTFKAAVAIAMTSLALASCGGGGDSSPAASDAELIKAGTLTVCSDVPYPPFEDFDKSSPSGYKGFDRQVWDAEIDQSDNSVIFSLLSADGDEGFPGRLVARSTYSLTEDDRLVITMTASSDQETVVNLIHHSYWNLAGHGSGDVLDQVLQVNAEFYTPVDDKLMPTGEILAVAGTALMTVSAGNGIISSGPPGGSGPVVCLISPERKPARPGDAPLNWAEKN